MSDGLSFYFSSFSFSDFLLVLDKFMALFVVEILKHKVLFRKFAGDAISRIISQKYSSSHKVWLTNYETSN